MNSDCWEGDRGPGNSDTQLEWGGCAKQHKHFGDGLGKTRHTVCESSVLYAWTDQLQLNIQGVICTYVEGDVTRMATEKQAVQRSTAKQKAAITLKPLDRFTVMNLYLKQLAK